jgi:hypothetical protein
MGLKITWRNLITFFGSLHLILFNLFWGGSVFILSTNKSITFLALTSLLVVLLQVYFLWSLFGWDGFRLLWSSLEVQKERCIGHKLWQSWYDILDYDHEIAQIWNRTQGIGWIKAYHTQAKILHIIPINALQGFTYDNLFYLLKSIIFLWFY